MHRTWCCCLVAWRDSLGLLLYLNTALGELCLAYTAMIKRKCSSISKIYLKKCQCLGSLQMFEALGWLCPVRGHTSVLSAGCSRCNSSGTNLIILMAFMNICHAFRAVSIRVQAAQSCFLIGLKASHTLIFPAWPLCPNSSFWIIFNIQVVSSSF